MFSCPTVHCLQAEPFSAVEVTTSRIFEQRHFQVIKVRLILGWDPLNGLLLGWLIYMLIFMNGYGYILLVEWLVGLVDKWLFEGGNH